MARKQKVRSTKQLEAIHIGQLPDWSSIETIEDPAYNQMLHDALRHYGYFFGVKELKKNVVKWLKAEDATLVDAYKKSTEWRTKPTAGALASMFLAGKPTDDKAYAYIMQNIASAISFNVADGNVEEEVAEETPSQLVHVSAKLDRYISDPSIQDRITAKVDEHILHIEQTWEDKVFAGEKHPNPEIKEYLAVEGVPAATVGRIVDHFKAQQQEILLSQSKDEENEDFREAYAHLTNPAKTRIKKFYTALIQDLELYQAQKKVARAPRRKKAVDKNKVVAKMQHLKKHDDLKLVSINPATIIDAKELWVYNTRLRKLGTYIAEDMGSLTVRGTTIRGFDPNKSLQKNLRKPAKQLAEFKKLGKVALRKHLKGIKATEIKLSGRITKDVILLKVH